MSKSTEIINLSYLLDNEKQTILEVLNRDEALRKTEEKRIRKLKNELIRIRGSGVNRRNQQINDRACKRCQKTLGLIFCRGDMCQICNERVCTECRIVSEDGSWKCNMCAKMAELRVVTGEWFFEERSKRFQPAMVMGSEVIKQSINRKTIDDKTQHSKQYLEEVSKTPTLTKNDKKIVPDALRRLKKHGKSKLKLQNEKGLDTKSEDGRNSSYAGSDFEMDSMHSVPWSGRGNSFGVETNATQVTPDGLRSSLPYINRSRTTTPVAQTSPSLSKRSITSDYMKAASSDSIDTLQMSNSVSEDLSRGKHNTPTIAISKYSISSDRSRSELDLSGSAIQGDDDSISLSSVPGGLNEAKDYMEEEEEEDIDDLVSIYRPNSIISSITTGLSTTSLNSMLSVYSETGDYGNVNISGEILFVVNYNYKSGALNINVKECRNLAIADERKQRTDPYVKAYLLPDKSRQSKRKTKLKSNTTNPIFNETLRYTISHTQLETRTLQLSVWHNDRFGRNSFLGEVEIPFDSWDFENQVEEWIPLQPKFEPIVDTVLQYKGELTVSLCYTSPGQHLTAETNHPKSKRNFSRGRKSSAQVASGGQLEVLIKEAKNLTAVKAGGTSDTFVKGYLLPDNSKTSKHKTPVIKKSVNPHWNHTFTYSGLYPNDLQNVCLELTVWDKESLSSNVFLGGIRLGTGDGRSYGNEVDWADSQGEEQHMWLQMIANPDVCVESTIMLRSSMGKQKF
ncbi:synaptotagmin-like protein 5 isoform X1 [Callorhinchus milii]|uniref:Synaptotagmin-like protein 5 n=1 Tax=Callorhinchus milii TaxID=7868 RepID=A0A4W3I8Q4_CALMI|nr:synaptotagmin-like protein 5 isoform X1 [Callorhinchus milii]|eukprot:gi/632937421/ref/XP_007899595.1/ PREDICTED: synaptotagmin-like protein 5 isoform X2 [Callorhinchus milii]